MKYKYIPHTADIQFQAFGKSLEEVFSNSLEAMIKSICDEKVSPKVERKIKVKGNDIENLLYNFLEEVLFLFDSKNFIFSKIKEIKIDKKKNILNAVLLGDSSEKYSTHLDIKAVTYNDMFVRFDNKKWIAQVTIDV